MKMLCWLLGSGRFGVNLRRLSAVLVLLLALLGTLSCSRSGDGEAYERLRNVISWIDAEPTMAEYSASGGPSFAWTYSGKGKEARLDMTQGTGSSGDFIAGPFWILDRQFYWVLEKNGSPQTISYDQIAQTPNLDAIRAQLEAISYIILLSPRAILAAIDPGTLRYGGDRDVLIGVASLRDVLAQYLPSKAVEFALEQSGPTGESLSCSVEVSLDASGRPLTTKVQWQWGKRAGELATWQWSRAPAPVEPPR